jgi:iron complex outermembrane receptor protein
MELGRRVEVDGVFRWVGTLRSQQVGAYSGLDLRLAWRLDPSWTVSATGRDLLQGHHAEFGGAGSAEIKRSVFLDLAWRR